MAALHLPKAGGSGEKTGSPSRPSSRKSRPLRLCRSIVRRYRSAGSSGPSISLGLGRNQRPRRTAAQHTHTHTNTHSAPSPTTPRSNCNFMDGPGVAMFREKNAPRVIFLGDNARVTRKLVITRDDACGDRLLNAGGVEKQSGRQC